MMPLSTAIHQVIIVNFLYKVVKFLKYFLAVLELT